MGPMTLWKHQNRSGDLLGPNCLRGPLFSFAVKPLYTDTRCVTALHSYTALYSAIHFTAIQLYSAIHYTTSTTPLWLLTVAWSPRIGRRCEGGASHSASARSPAAQLQPYHLAVGHRRFWSAFFLTQNPSTPHCTLQPLKNRQFVR